MKMSENYIKSTAADVPFTSNNEVLGREMEKLKKKALNTSN